MTQDDLGARAADDNGGSVSARAADDSGGIVSARAADDNVSGDVGATTSGNVSGSSEAGVSSTLVLLTLFSSIGGFILGYDRIIIATCMIFIREELHLTTEWHQIIVGGVYIMGVVTALVAGLLTDRLGRWIVIVMASVVYLLTAVIMATAHSRPQILVSRLLAGINMGLVYMSVPVYLSESSPARIRGRITVVYTLMTAVGQIAASIVAAPLSTIPNGWRYMIGMGAIPAIIMFFGFFFLPESPRWLVMKGKIEEAKKVLKSLRTSRDNWQAELEEIERASAENAQKKGIVLMFKTPTIRRALLLGVLLHVSQRLTGIAPIMSYSITILIKSGLTNKTTAIWYWAAVLSAGSVGYFFGLWLVEKVGRRPLVLASLVGVSLGLLMVAVIFHMIHIHGPAIQIPSTDPQCQADTCGVCTSRRHCGLCYTGQVGNEQNTSCVAVDPKSHYKVSKSGLCSNKQLLEDGVVTFAYGWCPYENARLILVGLTFFFFMYTLGMGSMPWTIASEIFPGWARSTATSITTAVNIGTNMVLMLSFLSLTETIFAFGVFYMLMSFTIVFFVVFLFILPETKGISLENMEMLFRKPLGTGILKLPRTNPAVNQS